MRKAYEVRLFIIDTDPRRVRVYRRKQLLKFGSATEKIFAADLTQYEAELFGSGYLFIKEEDK